MGSCLYFILEKNLGSLEGNKLSETDIREMLTFANVAASIITTRKGALRVMLSKEEIHKLYQ